MSDLTNAETALLGLLSEGAMHPYQIEKEVRYRDMRFWTELSMSSIYKLLRKLEDRELVQHEVEVSEDNRARKVYQVTEAGTAALRDQLAVLLEEPEHVRWRVDIGTYNLDLVDPTVAREQLALYRGKVEENIQGYRDLAKFLEESGCPRHRLGVATRPIHMLQGELAWLDEYVETLEG